MDKINPFRNSEKDELVNAVRAVLSGQEYKAPVAEHKGDKPHKHPHEEMDPVNPKAVKKKFKDRKDKDIDNDGDVDSSDKFLHKRRKAISKSVNEMDGQPAKRDKDGKLVKKPGYVVKLNPKKGYIYVRDTGAAVTPGSKGMSGRDHGPGMASVREDTNDNPANRQHLCAKNVVHEQWGQGTCIPTMHADPTEEGLVAWYDVMFEHGIETKVSIDELKVTKAEDHIHSSKKKKMKEDDDNGDDDDDDDDDDDEDKKKKKKNGKKDEVDTEPTTGDEKNTAE